MRTEEIFQRQALKAKDLLAKLQQAAEKCRATIARNKLRIIITADKVAPIYNQYQLAQRITSLHEESGRGITLIYCNDISSSAPVRPNVKVIRCCRQQEERQAIQEPREAIHIAGGNKGNIVPNLFEDDTAIQRRQLLTVRHNTLSYGQEILLQAIVQEALVKIYGKD